MKKYNRIVLTSLLAILVLSGCEKEELNHTNVSAVTNLYAPEDNAYFNLSAASAVVFEWEAAKAEDNGVVLYEVVFDKEEGDFSNPVYTVPSDGKGLQRTLDISFADLNKIAGMAGVQPEETGKLKWTVLSSKGINVQASQVARIIELERPAGFAPPAELYIAGTATEGGEDLSEAILMKKTSTSTFEVYTSLKPGEYFFAERNSGTPATYFIEGDKLKANGKTEVTGDEKVYRIKIDFTNATTQIDEIESVGLWFAPSDDFLFELPYVGNGTWEIKDAPIEFKQEGWGRDERYKFRFKVKDADGAAKEEWFGSTKGDNNRPNADEPESYWYMVPVSDDRWNNSFKFADAVDNNESDIQVVFNASVPAYTHIVTPK